MSLMVFQAGSGDDMAFRQACRGGRGDQVSSFKLFFTLRSTPFYVSNVTLQNVKT